MASIFAVLIVMAVALIRALKGPSLNDRLLAVNFFGTKTVLFIAILAFVSERSYFLDIAIIYALLNFVSVIGVLRFFEHRDAKLARKGKSCQN